MKRVLLVLIVLGLSSLSVLAFKVISSQTCEQQVQEAINVSTEKDTQAYEAGAEPISEGGQFITADGTYIPVHSFQLDENGTAEMDLNLPEEVLTVKKGDTFEVNGNVYSVYDIYAYPEVDASCQVTGPSGSIAIQELIYQTSEEKVLTDKNVLFTLNTQEFIFSEESIETVNRVIDIHEEYNVPIDIYLDGVILQTYLDEAPELIERLKSSPVVSISYHARPPMPYYNGYEWMDFNSMNDGEIEDIVEEYSTYEIDPATGETTDQAGGFSYFEDVFGYAPVAAATPTNGTTGPFVKSYFGDNGANFLVENDRDYSWGATKDGIAVRPEDVEVKLFERTDETPEEIFAELDALSGSGPYFMNIKMHDNDFITDESAWVNIYVANKKANKNQLTPPFDLSKAENRVLLTDTEAEELWSAYEACVEYASEHTDEYTLWNMMGLTEQL